MKADNNFNYAPSPSWAWKFKDLLLEELKNLPDEFTLAFSGGIDSSMLLYGMMEIGKPPKQLLTFQIEDWETLDLIHTRRIARELGIPLTISKVPIPTLQELNSLVFDIRKASGTYQKIAVQVCHAFRYMLKDIQTSNIVLGMYEDVIYETNAQLSIKYSEVVAGTYDVDKFNEEYNKWKSDCYYDKTEYGTTHNHWYINKYIESSGVNTFYPLKSKPIYELFQNVDYPSTHFVPYKDEFKLKKKWFVTDLLFKDAFEHFGNGDNNSNMHTKKEGNDINTLHCQVYDCKPKQLVHKYKMANKYVRNRWFN